MDANISINGQVTGTINFAMQQNYIPVIRRLVFTNQGEGELENLRVRISFEPEFAHVFEAQLPKLAPGVPVELSPVRIVMHAEYLFSLTERMEGSIRLEVLQGDVCLHTEYISIALLAYDQWPGLLQVPEMITAFVTPNHPRVAELTARAGVWLQKWLGEPSFTGYQSRNPNIVKTQAAAIYAALQEENIAYHMPPASYETLGQRVRLPHAVLEQKCGTCLDLAVLYAACLEAVGLNSLLVFIQGHAFAGVWLEEETFAECVEDDVSALTKRLATGIDQLFLVECTDYVAGKSVDFDHAGKHGTENLENPAEFRCAIDVGRCRGSGIRPIPTRITQDGKFASVDYGTRREAEITAAPREIDLALHGAASQEQEVTRKTIWERKLLDLSLRNSLLNFRPTASSIQLMTADLGKLEDEVSRGEDFKIMPAPNDFTLTLSDSKIFEIENERDLITTIAESEFKSKRLRTFMNASDLERTLKKLHRQSKVSLEENGANTLYLALGFLRWFETEKSERPRYAPLVLIPVDIIRKIQDRSYSIRIRDEEPQMNVTLLEMLRQDFGIKINGLNPLPEDESGVDLPLVYNTVRQGIMSRKHWDIEEVAFLGQFSFSQFIMWNDIRSRSGDLEQNKVVSSLMAGSLTWEPEQLDMTPARLDAQVSPCDMAVPTSADSSQLAAIYDASRGQSFVLHGPPGTGKSQTITNMIANALYNGRSVLFVAEKMAALSVVQKRLAAIGLDPFCLELHSNKAQKKAVLNQLERTLEMGHIKAPEEYAREEVRLHSLRQELNGVMEELYRQRPVGMSVYDAILMQEECPEEIALDPAFVETADAEQYAAWTDAVRKTAVAGQTLGGYRNSPLKSCLMREYTPELRQQFLSDANTLASQAGAATQAYGELDEGLPTDAQGSGYMLELLETAMQRSSALETLVFDEALEQTRAQTEALLENGAAYTALNQELSAEYEPAVQNFDSDAALLQWKQIQQKWFLPRIIGSGKQVKALAVYAKEPGRITKENITEQYRRLSECRQRRAQLADAPGALTSRFGALWLGEQTDFAALQQAWEDSIALRESLEQAGAYGTQARRLVRQLLTDSAFRSHMADALPGARQAWNAVQDTLSRMTVDRDALTAGENWFDTARQQAEGWAGDIDNLKSRVLLENSLDALRQLGLQQTVDAYTAGQVTEANLLPAFRKGVCKAVISSAFRGSPALSGFQGEQFEDTVNRYRETAERFQELTIQELAARLSAKIPATGSGAGSSELSVLQKAIRSGGRMLSIRKLFDSIPNLLRRLCPCMLMSPISVAQYIDPAFPKFDLVIFDEASQMPTCEAVGAIARGENVVVVGDPRQLPPTSFFASNQVDEEHYDQEDLESVLDDCLALAMPQRHLLWHYRSRHESLIAFSNARFYENKLFTFPSPDDLVSRVQWHHVEGFYDKGGTKQNRAEAEAIVAEILRRLSDEQLRRESIGVVTFSVVQQVLIDDLLAEEFRKQPQLEQYANQMYEPILVKNLENVQGDERDVILFSIGYGPDKEGRVSMNFGPVNRDGGWRRLNVAVSRARRQMQVYSVITPEQIDLSRTRSDGVAALRGFLEFAAKGTRALPVPAEHVEANSPFARQIAAALAEQGFQTRCGIGSSAYKVDVGVVDPDRPDSYLLGILCDNQQIFAATTARDRNLLQPSVLGGLGWQLFTVHILDWYENRQRTLERILAAIEAAKHSADRKPVPKAPAAEPIRSFEREKILTAAERCEAYKAYEPDTLGTPEQFYLPETKRKIMQVIRQAVETEAPVNRRAVLGHVLSAFGISRSGSRVEAVFDQAVQDCGIPSTGTGDDCYFWRDDQDPEDYHTCRIPKEDGVKRPMEVICPQELCAGMLLILEDQISMLRSDLLRETAKLFGYTRTGGVIEHAVNNAMDYALSRQVMDCEQERMTVHGA